MLLLLFLLADLFFFGLHFAFELRITTDPVFSLEGDRIAGEFWQYIKEYWIVVAMTFLFYRREWQPIYAAWALAFSYILADDSLQLHEKAGAKLAAVLNLPGFAHMLPRELGQALFVGFCGVVLLLAISLFYRRANPQARQLTRIVVFGLLLVAVFAVGGDLLHAMTASDALIVVEEGGELLVMSVLCALLLSEAWRTRSCARTGNAVVSRIGVDASKS